MGHTPETVTTTRTPVFPKRLMADETPPPLIAKVLFLQLSFVTFHRAHSRVLLSLYIFLDGC